MKKLLFIPLFVVMVNCGKKKEETNNAVEINLDGTWISGCNSSEGNFVRQTVTIAGTSFSSSMVLYPDANCNDGDEILAGRNQANIRKGAAAASPSDATKIDFLDLTAYLTPKKEAYATQFNTISLYGKSNWAVNVETEISGLSQAGTESAQVALYDIFKLTGSQLCLGADSTVYDRSSEDKRPTELNTGTSCLTKQ